MTNASVTNELIAADTELPFEKFVEVQIVGGASKANKYLNAGYRLIQVQSASALVPADKAAGLQPFVKKFTAFVVGRTSDVSPLPMT